MFNLKGRYVLLLVVLGFGIPFVFFSGDEELARYLCEEQDQAYSCWSAGRYEYDKNDAHSDITLKYYTRGCELGLGSSCDVVFGYYWNMRQPITAARDLEKAFFYVKKACENGYEKSCHNMGLMYRKGIGVERNFDNGVRLYVKMCERNIGVSCYNVALQYANIDFTDKRSGEFKSINWSKATEYFVKACELGTYQGCEEGARFLEKKEPQRSAELRKRAKELEDAEEYWPPEGSTNSSRLAYFRCAVKNREFFPENCNPHLNIPQYVFHFE